MVPLRSLQTFLPPSLPPSGLPLRPPGYLAFTGLTQHNDVSHVVFITSSTVWCLMWCGVVWCGVVWCGVVWCGLRVRSEGTLALLRQINRKPGCGQSRQGWSRSGLTHTIQWSRCSYLLCYRYPYLQLLYHFINVPFL